MRRAFSASHTDTLDAAYEAVPGLLSWDLAPGELPDVDGDPDYWAMVEALVGQAWAGGKTKP